LRFPDIILRVLRLEVSVYIVYITIQFKPLLLKRKGVKPSVEVTVNSKEENSEEFCPNTSKNSASGNKGVDWKRVRERTT
jgi:hypothetical protein